MIKVSIQEHITIVIIYAPNVGTTKYINQILTDIKGEIYSNTVMVITHPSYINRQVIRTENQYGNTGLK